MFPLYLSIIFSICISLFVFFFPVLENNTLSQFIGRFHPIFVHFPIALLSLVPVADLLVVLFKKTHWKVIPRFLLFVSTPMSIISLVTGTLLASNGDYTSETFFDHRWMSVTGIVLAFLMMGLRFKWDRTLTGNTETTNIVATRAYALLSIFMVLFVSMAAHHGGSLTHGEDYLTKYFPYELLELENKKSTHTKTTKTINKDEIVVFTTYIKPIIDRYCISCHGEEKQKGKLRLDTYEAMLKGNEYGTTIVTGKSWKSPLATTLRLPLHDELHMPPEGKKQLNDTEIKLLEWWIDQGASQNAQLKEFKIDKRVSEYFGIEANQ